MEKYDLVVIGAGPGGYVSAIRASQMGLKVALVEKDKPGGVCLNVGCIPTKTLIHYAHIYSSISSLKKMGLEVTSSLNYKYVFQQSRKAAQTLSRGVTFLLKKNKVEYITGFGEILNFTTVLVNGDTKLKTKHILISTGSVHTSIPNFEVDENNILSSTGAIMLEDLPQKMLIIGSGAVGSEFAYIFNTFGVEVHLVEIMDRILPTEDKDSSSTLLRAFKREKIKVYTSSEALNWEKKDGKISVLIKTKGKEKRIDGIDKILVAVGRKPVSSGIGLERVGIPTTSKGFVEFGDYYQTQVPNIYAVGDVINTPQLAHCASKEGEIAVSHMAGKTTPKKLDYMSLPSGIYTNPQVASFGYREQDLIANNIPYKKGVFPFRANGKAVCTENIEGHVKILSDEKGENILGAHIVGEDATEIIHEILLAKTCGVKSLSDTVHAHPTLSEAIMEASMTISHLPIHI